MKTSTKELPGLEKLGYYYAVIVTLGFFWLIKIVIKKAIIEAIKE